MQAPVGLLIVPSVLAGWLLFGGENSLWHRFFAAQFRAETLHAPVPELVTTLIVLVVVAAGIGLAYLRYASPAALADANARIARESVHMPPVLSNAFYFDTALDFLFVRPALWAGSFFSQQLDPVVIDGAVRETVISSRWLGHLFRSFQTGLVRAYALIIVFGAACFIAYYAFAGGLR